MASIRHELHRIEITRNADAARPESVVEGRCPTCAGDLERRADHGWCSTCKVGWSYRSTGSGTAELTMVLVADVSGFTAACEQASNAITKRRHAAP